MRIVEIFYSHYRVACLFQALVLVSCAGCIIRAVMEPQTVLQNVRDVAAGFAQERKERQRRRHLEPADFALLKDAGFLLTGVPAARGGLWKSVRESTRPVCEILRALAAGDASVALVCSMHPAVLSFWLASPKVDADRQKAWDEQTAHLAETAQDGRWWGTITSEPGSGGDILRTKAVAARDGDEGAYRISGAKHFGSGSGITWYMITTALPEGEEEPDLFFMDVRDVPWDGSAGITLIAEWDGHGMTATQSHAMQFDGFPATRCAWPGHLLDLAAAAGPYVACSFTAVIVGIVDAAIETAQAQLRPRHDKLRPYEQVEWSRVEMEAWLIRQAYEGMLHAVEEDREPLVSALRGKTAVAELAEAVLARISKVVGGGTYNRTSPFGFWYEDVRALGFLRPPWGLAFDQLFALSPIHPSE
jgi:alkylation response protein AidB-like acyl-CoA dehydrogenase